MSPQAVIRQFEPRDTDAVRRCVAALQTYERTLEADRVEATPAFAASYLDRILAASHERDGEILVAEVEGAVVGFVCYWMMTIQNPITTVTGCAYVADLAVLEAYRRRGIGRALLRAAEVGAARHGATTIRIEVLAANHPARDLYDAEGFRPYEMLLTKPLTPPS